MKIIVFIGLAALLLFFIMYYQVLIDAHYLRSYEKFKERVDPKSPVKFIRDRRKVICKALDRNGKECSIELFEFRRDFGFFSPTLLYTNSELQFYEESYKTAESIIKKLEVELRAYKLNQETI